MWSCQGKILRGLMRKRLQTFAKRTLGLKKLFLGLQSSSFDSKQSHLIPMFGKGILYIERVSTFGRFAKPEKGRKILRIYFTIEGDQT